jgi:hypothetical protein
VFFFLVGRTSCKAPALRMYNMSVNDVRRISRNAYFECAHYCACATFQRYLAMVLQLEGAARAMVLQLAGAKSIKRVQ